MGCTNDGLCLELSIAATKSCASAGIAEIGARLAVLGLPESQADGVKIALAEAINNVVEHAYAGYSPATVEVGCKLWPDKLDILISDNGDPMPGFCPPEGRPAPIGTSLQELPEGGFGWFLIRKLTSDIRYERSKGRNRLHLHFDFRNSH